MLDKSCPMKSHETWRLDELRTYILNYATIQINALRPRQNERRFADDIFKYIYLSENVWIPIKVSLKFVPKAPINNILALVQIMAWRRPGDKTLSQPMVISLPTHICVTRPQRVNWFGYRYRISYPMPLMYQQRTSVTKDTTSTLRMIHIINFQIYYYYNIRTLHDCPSQMNSNLLISNSKLTSDSELIWWR